MTTEIDGDSSVSDSTQIDDADSAYTTQGESVIEVDTSNGTVTVTLASADASDNGRILRIVDDGGNANTNNITVNTEGGETIDPGGASSKTVSTNHAHLVLEANGSDWNAVLLSTFP